MEVKHTIVMKVKCISHTVWSNKGKGRLVKGKRTVRL